MSLRIEDILHRLRLEQGAELDALWREADAVRKERVGDAVHLRGLIEFSNECARNCLYCGLRAANRNVQRFRLSCEQVLQCAARARDLGYGTVVLQAGEDGGLDPDWLARVVRDIKEEIGLAVTLSVGEWGEKQLAIWREAGADRYLLRFETSNRALFDRIHPPRPHAARFDRIAQLRILRRLGYEVGSGVMVGVPGQSYDDLARDILLFRDLDLDMIGVGPFVPHPDTPLGRYPERMSLPDGEQVPNTELMAYKTFAIARLTCPNANIPATTAVATLNPSQGYELALSRGANVVMPNVSPLDTKINYEIYPNKAGSRVDPYDNDAAIKQRILALGRTLGTGPGDSPNITRRRTTPSGAL
jgi:biotin synthase